MSELNGERGPQPENYDDPFAYALAVGSSSTAMQVVWDRWQGAAEECQRHQVGQTYDVGHEHGVLTAMKKMRSMLDDVIVRAAHSGGEGQSDG